MKSLEESKKLKHFCTSQRQAIIEKPLLLKNQIKIKYIFPFRDLFHY